MTTTAPSGVAAPMNHLTPIRPARARAAAWPLLTGSAGLLAAAGYATIAAISVIRDEPTALGGIPTSWAAHAALVVQLSAPSPMLLLLAAVLLAGSALPTIGLPMTKPVTADRHRTPGRILRSTQLICAALSGLAAAAYIVVGAVGLTIAHRLLGQPNRPPHIIESSNSATLLALGLAALAILTALLVASRTTRGTQ
jgi:hypothetical protein